MMEMNRMNANAHQSESITESNAPIDFNMDEVTSPFVKFDEEGHEYIFTGWRIDSMPTGKIDPKTRKPEMKPALYLECISIDGFPSSKYVQITSVRLNGMLEPIIKKAIKAGQGQIHVFIKKILGWDEETDTAKQTANTFEVEDKGFSPPQKFIKKVEVE
jgi:hypothetical protein